MKLRDSTSSDIYLYGAYDPPSASPAPLETFRPEADPSMPERFWKFVKKTDGCWLWTGGFFHDGYGQIWAKDKRYVRTHRASWLLHFGHIPDEMQVCHTCDTPACVRPDHLFLGTHQDNVDDCRKKGRHSQAERHYKAKLTPDQVRQIVERYRAGGISQLKLAKEYGVAEPTIYSIVHGESWKALKLPVIVQTPGHSGPYQGKIPVRVLPAGMMLAPDFAPVKFSETRRKGDIRSTMAREVAYVMEKRRIAGLRSKQRRKMSV